MPDMFKEQRLRSVALGLLPVFAVTIAVFQAAKSYVGVGSLQSRSSFASARVAAASDHHRSGSALGTTVPTGPGSARGWCDVGMLAGASVGLVASFATVARSARSPVAMRFFGGRPSNRPQSYKEYNDTWLTFADNGFDPLSLALQPSINFGDAVTTYYNYRESEVKHGRFAMGAFLAIFGEQNDRDALFNQLGLPGYTNNLDATLALDEVQWQLLAIGILIQAFAEISLQSGESDGKFFSVEYNPNRVPGDLQFDPLNFKGLAGGDIRTLHNTEVLLGRLAMIGITTFLVREFVVSS